MLGQGAGDALERLPMRPRHSLSLALAVAVAVAAFLAGCGSSAPADVPTPLAQVSAIPAPASSAGGPIGLTDWPEFGLDRARSDVSELATGITAANVGHLRSLTVSLPGTVDSSPIYLHGVTVDGAVH